MAAEQAMAQQQAERRDTDENGAVERPSGMTLGDVPFDLGDGSGSQEFWWDNPLTAAAGRGHNDHAELLLSTFLLLTAFFAVLVSLSHFETRRTQLVLNSIAEVFATDIASSRDQTFSDADESSNFAESADDLRRLLERSLAVTARSADPLDGQFVLDFAAPRLFEPNSAVIRSERQVMLGRIAQQLAGARGSPTVKLFIVANAGGETSADPALTMARLAAIQDRLRKLGANQDSNFIGFGNAGDGRWRFEFRHDD